MKKVIFSLSFLAALTFAIVSCDKKDDPEPSEKDSDSTVVVIPGDTTVTTPGDTLVNDEPDPEPTPDPEPEPDNNVKELLVGTWAAANETAQFCDNGNTTWTFNSNDTYTLNCPDLGDFGPYSYNLSSDGKTLTIEFMFTGEDIETKVLEITETTLKVEEEGDGVVLSYTKE